MKCYLRPSGEPMASAKPYGSVSQAATAYKREALTRPGYRASIHVGHDLTTLSDKPDYNLTLSSRGVLQLRKVP